ncbi:hypothetical protein [Flavobacterium flavipallidum]|uniref:Uncharacterized protein n=1 Tax=Flavobacterium flavipallidum TaxID=3139140 RepID=A0ABU9HQN1_9FLAO
MKTIIIILMSMITTVFYAQTADEIELGNRINNIVLNNIPSLTGKDYFIFDAIEGQIYVISKIDNNYTYYNLQLGSRVTDGDKIIATKTVSYKPVLDKIFTNFVPKAGVKRYLSEYGNLLSDDSFGSFYIAIYKNGIKTFDTSVLSIRITNRESPIDDEILEFFYYYLIANPDQL